MALLTFDGTGFGERNTASTSCTGKANPVGRVTTSGSCTDAWATFHGSMASPMPSCAVSGSTESLSLRSGTSTGTESSTLLAVKCQCTTLDCSSQARLSASLSSPIETQAFAKRINALGGDYLDAPASDVEVGAKAASRTLDVHGERMVKRTFARGFRNAV